MQLVAGASKEVQKVTGLEESRGECFPYTWYSCTLCAESADYSCQKGAAAVAQHFLGKFEHLVRSEA